MELINHTSFQHMYFRTIVDDETTAVSIALRVIHDFNDENEIVFIDKDDLKMSQMAWVGKYGHMESDMIFRRGGVDVYIHGHAYPDEPGRTRKMKVSFYHNNVHKSSLNVYGDRRWELGISGYLKMSAPEIFDRIPLTLEYAYGGKADWDGLEIPCSTNSYGRGYYLSKEDARGNLLPNLEFDEFEVIQWEDQPDPSGFGQFPICGFRFKRGCEWNEDYSMKALHPEFYNCSAPNMILDKVEVGDELKVVGASPDRVFSVKIPTDRFAAIVKLGDKSHEKLMYIDQIGLIPDENRMFITYRYHFLYKVKSMEKRILEIKKINVFS